MSAVVLRIASSYLEVQDYFKQFMGMVYLYAVSLLNGQEFLFEIQTLQSADYGFLMSSGPQYSDCG